MKSLFLALLLQHSAFAFHIEDHRAITDRAILGLQKCGLLPGSWDMGWGKAIADGNELEDTDLIRKWGKYSHFYNPFHPIKQSRVDSSVTITESVADILKNPKDAATVNLMVGRIVHHIQDSSVPAHAVPVMHAISDGFETFKVDSVFAEPVTPEECQLISLAEPMSILHDNASATLKSLNQELLFSIDGAPAKGSWIGNFWALGQGNEFGTYGVFGDKFGVTDFSLRDGRKVSVHPSSFTSFKRDQVIAAIRATQSAILWANKTRGL